MLCYWGFFYVPGCGMLKWSGVLTVQAQEEPAWAIHRVSGPFTRFLGHSQSFWAIPRVFLGGHSLSMPQAHWTAILCEALISSQNRPQSSTWVSVTWWNHGLHPLSGCFPLSNVSPSSSFWGDQHFLIKCWDLNKRSEKLWLQILRLFCPVSRHPETTKPLFLNSLGKTSMI